MKKIILLLFFSPLLWRGAGGEAFSQTPKIDSLQNILKTAQHDTVKINTLNALSWELLNQGDYEKAMQYANDALQFFQSSKTLEKLFLKGKATAYNNIGEIHRNKGKYDKALEFYFKALKIREEIGDKKEMAISYNNIGIIHKKEGDYDKALEFYFKALKIREAIGDKKGMAGSYHNIGIIYDDKSDYDKALEFYFKALKINEEVGNKNWLANNYLCIGGVHQNKGDYDKTLEFYFKSLNIKEEIGDKNGMAVSYGNIGTLFIQQKKYNEARAYLNKGLVLSKTIGTKEWTRNAYENLSQLESMLGNWKAAYEYQKLYSETKDSIFNEESSKQIAEMSTKYETEKKEQQIKLLNKDKEIQAKDLERQKTIRNAVAGGLILVLLFSFVLINRLLLIRKQKKVIEIEREKSEKLLLNILPKEIAEELKINNSVNPQFYKLVTVMFTDFKGFTTIAEKMSAEELVSELDFIFKKFDEIISHYPIEKIKTIGDAYMCAGGLPVANTTNPMDVVLAGLEIQEWMKAQNKWQLRLGIHTGSVIAGVVGDKKFAYDIWGDAVNTASRMESSGEAGKVNISGTTYELIKDHLQTTNYYQLQTIYRGEVEAKNKGKIKMYFVEK